MRELIIQAFVEQQWQDVATLFFNDNKTLEKLTYSMNYIAPYFGERGSAAVSINYPVEPFIDANAKDLYSFLNDIMPTGASLRYWREALDLKNVPEEEHIYQLLKKATIAPVGHLRIKEAVQDDHPSVHFDLKEVLNRNHEFLEYASQHGAMVGGATGAGGEAPKLLLRRTEQNQVWIDNAQTGNDPSRYYLVKYPRGNYSPIDCDILRAEFHYYHELNALGFSTIKTQHMRLEEGEKYPSLWLPRFDIVQNSEGKMVERYALESVYSMLQKGGGFLDHRETIADLINKMQVSELNHPSAESFVIEWVKRDLLNIAFGNSDNHGRNTAFLRNKTDIWLAPIYDFAPMRADPEMIIRSTKWNNKQETGIDYHFDLIAESLAEWVSPEKLLTELQHLAQQLVTLKVRLTERGVPQAILQHPALAFDYLPEKLKKWGLV